MPELPEVHTTVEGLKKVAAGKTILEIWSDFHVSTSHGERDNIKNERHYKNLKKLATGSKIENIERLGKNILIHLSSGHTIAIHMKMTGHLMYGKYKKQNIYWKATEDGPLQDPYNQYIHFVASLSCGKHLVLSDMRRFASVSVFKSDSIQSHASLSLLGPDALKIDIKDFKKRIKEMGKMRPIKTVLLDQEIIAGIGNIYSDEILWKTGVHPLSPANKVPESKISEIYKEMRRILQFSIDKGGDSKSDYRNVFGEKGGFQNFHKAYGNKGKKCPRNKCSGIIERIMVKTRSSHFCPVHQKLFK